MAEAVPFSPEGVWLGLADRLLVRRSPEELADPQAWILDDEGFRGEGEQGFRGYVGPFSALDLLSEAERVTVSIGPHRHCASPPVPPPEEMADLRRVSVQPRFEEAYSCLDWWTVDLFVTADGEIAAVTLDLWEP